MVETHECKMKERLTYIENDIKELKDSSKEYSKNMSELKESHTETKIYVKQIFEVLASITATLKTITDKPSKRWEQVLTTIITVGVTMAITYVITKK